MPSLAWSNLKSNKKRAFAAVYGIGSSIILIFMQLGFLSAAKTNATLVIRLLDCDILLVPSNYFTLISSGTINYYRVIQAAKISGVESSSGLDIRSGLWKNRNTKENKSCLIFGVNRGETPFLDQSILMELPKLATDSGAAVLIDQRSQNSYGPRAVGDTGIINNTPLRIIGEYEVGAGFLAAGSAITGRSTFYRLFPDAKPDEVTLGLVKVKPGTDIEAVKSAITQALPSDITVFTRDEVIALDEYYYIHIRPYGIMFQIGAFVAFIIGGVILYQVLSTEITNRLKEFATLKAIGYHERFIYRIGAEQAIILSLFGYVPALIVSIFIYRFICRLTKIPISMTLSRASFVFVITIVMCTLAAIIALKKVKKADPADLF